MQKVYVCIIFIYFLKIFGLAAQDTTPPVITSPARDTAFDCNPNNNIIQKLTDWYQNAAGATATDDVGVVGFVGNFSLGQSITIFNNSLDVLCGNRRSVTVSFTATDASGNNSSPTTATFQTIDTIGPAINTVSNVEYFCIEGIRDTLIKWIKNKGGYEATDLCSNSVNWSTFQYAISNSTGVLTSGGGSITSGPYPMIPDSICDWTLNINFFVRDECGNLTITPGTTSFSVIDNVAPIFTDAPANVTVDCDKIPQVPKLNVLDYCDRSVVPVFTESSTKGPDKNLCNHYNYTITRTWRATDACGNSSQHTQVITVRDATPPNPTNIAVAEISCVTYATHPDSIYVSFTDACSPVITTFTDVNTALACTSTYLRTYRVGDVCGNTATFQQQLRVIQNEKPLITKQAIHRTFDCNTTDNLDQQLSEWLAIKAGSTAQSACGPIRSFAAVRGSYQLQNPTTYPGILPTTLPAQSCPSPLDGFIRSVEVDFVYYDTCGNAAITTAVFGIADTTKPKIDLCPGGFNTTTADNDCFGKVEVPIPAATDNCTEADSPIKRNIMVPLTSATPAGPEAIVDAFTLKFGPFNPVGANPLSNGSLKISMINVDIDDNTEFFRVYDEDNNLIGNTPVGIGQCASTTFEWFLDKDKIGAWIQDGFISLRFEPNIEPSSPILSINNFCGKSTVEVALSYEIDLKNAINVFYSLHADDPWININELDTLALDLPSGKHQLQLFFQDCAKNHATCLIPIEVKDNTRPVITCPPQITTTLGEGLCSDTIDFPTAINVVENCSGTKKYEAIRPISMEAALVTFLFNDALNQYVARSKSIVFDNVFAVKNLKNNITLEIYFTGDNAETGAYFDIFGPQGYLIGKTISNAPTSCNTVTSRFEVPVEVFNSWIVNNQITIIAVPNNTTNQYINPCGTIPNNASTDGISSIQAKLLYTDAIVTLSVAGATTISTLTLNNNGDAPYSLVLNGGLNTVTLNTIDDSGNRGSCNVDIVVKDTEKPKALCKNATVTVHPSGLTPTELDATLIDNGSNDNCDIASLRAIPPSFDCNMADSDRQVQLVITDIQGNTDTCATTVRVKSFPLTPSFASGLCADDTLKLFANLPPSDVEGTYTFQWDGPNDIEFFTENPIIVNADESYNGVYVLTVKGFNDCRSVGSVSVNITPLIKPILTPNKATICENEDLVLTTTNYSGNIEYQWYAGIFPTGVLIKTTTIPELILNPVAGNFFYYVIAKGPNCISNPSSLLRVEVKKIPQALPCQAFISVCEASEIKLCSTGNPNFEYQWSGPDGYFEKGQNPRVITDVKNTAAGNYFLTVKNGQCISDTGLVKVVVLESPAQPMISGDELICEGITFNLLATSSPLATKFEWFKDNVLFTSTLENNLIIANANELLEGSWKVRALAGECASAFSNIKVVAIDNILEIAAINFGPVCVGDSVTLQATFVPNASYKWEGPVDDIPPVFNPKILGLAGDYAVTITTLTGCQNNTNTTVIVNEVPEITALSNTSKACLEQAASIEFSPSVFPNIDTYTYQWSGPNGFVSNLKNPVLTDLTLQDTGIYELVIINRGCPSKKVSTKVDFNFIPDKPILKAKDFYCTGEDLIIYNDPSTENDMYTWNTPLGTVTTAIDTLIIRNTNTSNQGEYSLIVESAACLSPRSEAIKIDIRPRPDAPVLSADTPVCFGDTLNIESNFQAMATYQWAGPVGVSSSTRFVSLSEANQNMSGNYVATALINGCVSQPSTPIEVLVLPEIKAPEFLITSLSICATNSLNAEICFKPSSLQANANYLILEAASTAVLANGNNNCLFLSNIDPLKNGVNTLVARASIGACQSVSNGPFILNINEPPNIKAEAQDSDIKICPDESVRLISKEGPPLVNVLWTADDPTISISDKNSIAPIISNLREGNNRLFLSYSADGCIDFSRDTISVYAEFLPLTNDDIYTLTYGQIGTFDVLTNDVVPNDYIFTITKNPANGQATINGSNLIYTPDTRFLSEQTIEYRVCASFCADLCDQSTITINFDDNIICRPPNIFTPNGDGINDNFVLPCLESGRFPNNKISIFNEWGSEVYAASPYLNDWNGSYGGNPLPVGTYFYVIDTGDGQKPLNGFLILQR